MNLGCLKSAVQIVFKANSWYFNCSADVSVTLCEELIPEDTVIVNPEAPSTEQEEAHNSQVTTEMQGWEILFIITVEYFILLHI